MATPVILDVERREFPSTRADITWARRLESRRFILIIILERHRTVNNNKK